MKGIKIAVFVIFTAALICALALTADARWWDENPFTDVKSDAWYYDAVRFCKENELMIGTSEDRFDVDKATTRAMFVTTLAKAAHYDDELYGKKATPFDDVTAAWYKAPVAWAYENGVTGGTGDGKFSPQAAISRQEIAVMLCRFAQLKGLDVSVKSATLDPFPDAFDVADWALDAMRWAYENGVISGSAVGDEVLLLPRTEATRAQIAQMTVRFLALTPVREINGNDLSLYRIVYNENEEGSEDTSLESAERLAAYIKNSLGYDLPIVKDTEEPTEYEILVGRTAREDAGLVTVDRGAFESDQQFLCQVQGNRLVLAGIDADSDNDDGSRTTMNVSGTRNAVFYFVERAMGVEVYSTSRDGIYKYNPDPVISLDDGWTYIDAPYMRQRRFFMSGGVLGTGSYRSDVTYCASAWLNGPPWNEDEVMHDRTPCLSDPDNLNAIIDHIKLKLSQRPHANEVGFGINDSNGCCQCKRCNALYQQYGTRAATLCLAVNQICEALEEDYPTVRVKFGAYTYVVKPPKGLVMHKNALVEYYTINNCYGHAYTDETCPYNYRTAEYIAGWHEICDEMVLWDHCGAFTLMMTPVPDWDSMLENIRYFADEGAHEVLMNSVLDSGYKYSDFGYLRGYMYSRLYMDPYMSEEEFDYRLNKGLEAYYGPGWKNIREYIDTIALLGNSKHHSHHDNTSLFYDFDEVAAVADHLDDLWDAAFAAAKATGNADFTDRLTLAVQSWIFLRQSAVYKSRYTNGTEEQREEYARINQELYDYIIEHDIVWTEGTLDDLSSFSPYVAPCYW